MNITLKNCDWINKVTCCQGETVYPLTNANQVEYISGYDSNNNPIIGTLQDWIDSNIYSLQVLVNPNVFDETPDDRIASIHTSTIRFGKTIPLNEYNIYNPVIRKEYPIAEDPGTRDYADNPYYGLIKINPLNFTIDEDTDEVSLDIQFVEGDYSVDAYGKCAIGYLSNGKDPLSTSFVKYGDDIKISIPEVRGYINNSNLVLQTVMNNIVESQSNISVDDIVSALQNNAGFQSLLNSRYSLTYNSSLQQLKLINTIDNVSTDISTINLVIPTYSFNSDQFIIDGNQSVSLNLDNLLYTAANYSGLTFDNENKTIGHTNIIQAGTFTPTYTDGVVTIPQISYDINGHITSITAQAFDVCNGGGCCCEKMNLYPNNLLGFYKGFESYLYCEINHNNLKSYAHIYESGTIAEGDSQIIFDVWFPTPRRMFSFVVNINKSSGTYTITNLQIVSGRVKITDLTTQYVVDGIKSYIGNIDYDPWQLSTLESYSCKDSQSTASFLIWESSGKLHFAIGDFVMSGNVWNQSNNYAFPSSMLSDGEDVHISIRASDNVWSSNTPQIQTEVVANNNLPNVSSSSLLIINSYSSITSEDINPYFGIGEDANHYDNLFMLPDGISNVECKDIYIKTNGDDISYQFNNGPIYMTGIISAGSYDDTTHILTLGADTYCYSINVSKMNNLLSNPLYLYDIKEFIEG